MGSPNWTVPRGPARPSSGRRFWRRHSRHVRVMDDRRVPGWVRFVILAALLAVVGTITWRGVQERSHPPRRPPAGLPATASNPAATPPAAWQRDVTASFDSALRDATAGNLSAAEMAVDRGASMMIAARVRLQPTPPAYFESAVAQLDRVVAAHPGNARLDEHVNLARIELAQLRSALDPDAAKALPGQKDPQRVAIYGPLSVDAGTMVDPGLMHGSFLDARLMPHTSELLEPPSSRSFADRVRVEGLTFAGATQTLDGIRFKDVTFIGTRLRFEGGQVELQNVRFVRCTFGFTTDARGARLANAVALGQPSLLIE